MTDRVAAATLKTSDGTYTFDTDSGSATLDETWSPYLQANLTLKMPTTGSAATIDTTALAALNADTTTYKFSLTATISQDGTVTSTLSAPSLNLSSSTVDYAASTVQVLLTSDEFILQQKGNTAATSDVTVANFPNINEPFATGGTYGGWINDATPIAGYPNGRGLFGKAGIAPASLTTATAVNSTPYWATVTNWVLDPGSQGDSYVSTSSGSATFSVSTNGSTPAGRYTAGTWAASTANPNIWFLGSGTSGGDIQFDTDPVRASQYVEVVADIGSSIANSTTNLIVRFFDSTGRALPLQSGPTVASPTSGFVNSRWLVAVPARAASMSAGVSWNGTMAAGFVGRVASMMVTNRSIEGDTQTSVPWFNGATTDTSTYTYFYSNGAVGSSSVRQAVSTLSPEAFIITPGQDYWAMLDPILSGLNVRLYCDGGGNWFIRSITSDASAPSGTLTITPTTTTAASVTTDRTDSTDYCGAVVVTFTWVDGLGNTSTAYQAAGTGFPIRQVAVSSAPVAGLAQSILTRALSSSSTVPLTAMTDYTAQPGLAVSWTDPTGTVNSKRIQSVSFDLAQAEMALVLRDSRP